MTFKNLLLSFSANPAYLAKSPYDADIPIYKVNFIDEETTSRVKIIYNGGVIMQQSIAFYPEDARESAIEECCKQLFIQIFMIGAKNINNLPTNGDMEIVYNKKK